MPGCSKSVLPACLLPVLPGTGGPAAAFASDCAGEGAGREAGLKAAPGSWDRHPTLRQMGTLDSAKEEEGLASPEVLSSRLAFPPQSGVAVFCSPPPPPKLVGHQFPSSALGSGLSSPPPFLV